MNKASLIVNFPAGTDIKEAATEAIRIARVIGCLVEFKFNDTDVVVDADSSTELVSERYLTRLERTGFQRRFIVGW